MTHVDFAVPPGACDCHVHVTGDPARFSMAPNRVYTPPPATPAMLLELQRALGLDRVVLIQPSFYGTDNAAMLDALKVLGPRRARAVAVVEPDTSETTLDQMRSAGVRGIRLNLETGGQVDEATSRSRLKTAVAQCLPRNWHIQLYTRPTMIAALADQLTATGLPLVFDHFAGAEAELGPAQPGFEAVVALVRAGKAYVKLSGAYRASKLPPPYEDVRPLAEALVAANPERMLWGSDWPHPDATRIPGRTAMDITPRLPIDDGLVLNQLARWVPDEATRRRILVANPARLYGF
jgi:predicted TIM-barrel fold metal-dependent hydrolase